MFTSFAGPKLPKLNIPTPSVPMKGFNWSKLPNNKVTNTIFMDAIKEKDLDLDFKEIETLFCKKIIEKKIGNEYLIDY